MRQNNPNINDLRQALVKNEFLKKENSHEILRISLAYAQKHGLLMIHD